MARPLQTCDIAFCEYTHVFLTFIRISVSFDFDIMSSRYRLPFKQKNATINFSLVHGRGRANRYEVPKPGIV